ncbi:hypothetical protein BB560_001674, partial [Smittium megazygosporum]
MLFVPINLSDEESFEHDSLSDDEIVRESEIEDIISKGFSQLQNALGLQKAKDWSGALSSYSKITTSLEIKDIIVTFRPNEIEETLLDEDQPSTPKNEIDLEAITSLETSDVLEDQVYKNRLWAAKRLQSLAYRGMGLCYLEKVKYSFPSLIETLSSNFPENSLAFDDLLVSTINISSKNDKYSPTTSLFSVKQCIKLSNLLRFTSSISTTTLSSNPLTQIDNEHTSVLVISWLRNALALFLNSVRLKHNDSISWYCAGCCAMALEEYSVAKSVFTNGLVNSSPFIYYNCSKSFSCVDTLSFVSGYMADYCSSDLTGLSTSSFPTTMINFDELYSQLKNVIRVQNNRIFSPGPIGIWCLEGIFYALTFQYNFEDLNKVICIAKLFDISFLENEIALLSQAASIDLESKSSINQSGNQTLICSIFSKRPSDSNNIVSSNYFQSSQTQTLALNASNHLAAFQGHNFFSDFVFNKYNDLVADPSDFIQINVSDTSPNWINSIAKSVYDILTKSSALSTELKLEEKLLRTVKLFSDTSTNHNSTDRSKNYTPDSKLGDLKDIRDSSLSSRAQDISLDSLKKENTELQKFNYSSKTSSSKSLNDLGSYSFEHVEYIPKILNKNKKVEILIINDRSKSDIIKKMRDSQNFKKLQGINKHNKSVSFSTSPAIPPIPAVPNKDSKNDRTPFSSSLKRKNEETSAAQLNKRRVSSRIKESKNNDSSKAVNGKSDIPASLNTNNSPNTSFICPSFPRSDIHKIFPKNSYLIESQKTRNSRAQCSGANNSDKTVDLTPEKSEIKKTQVKNDLDSSSNTSESEDFLSQKELKAKLRNSSFKPSDYPNSKLDAELQSLLNQVFLNLEDFHLKRQSPKLESMYSFNIQNIPCVFENTYSLAKLVTNLKVDPCLYSLFSHFKKTQSILSVDSRLPFSKTEPDFENHSFIIREILEFERITFSDSKNQSLVSTKTKTLKANLKQIQLEEFCSHVNKSGLGLFEIITNILLAYMQHPDLIPPTSAQTNFENLENGEVEVLNTNSEPTRYDIFLILFSSDTIIDIIRQILDYEYISKNLFSVSPLAVGKPDSRALLFSFAETEYRWQNVFLLMNFVLSRLLDTILDGLNKSEGNSGSETFASRKSQYADYIDLSKHTLSGSESERNGLIQTLELWLNLGEELFLLFDKALALPRNNIQAKQKNPAFAFLTLTKILFYYYKSTFFMCKGDVETSSKCLKRSLAFICQFSQPETEPFKAEKISNLQYTVPSEYNEFFSVLVSNSRILKESFCFESVMMDKDDCYQITILAPKLENSLRQYLDFVEWMYFIETIKSKETEWDSESRISLLLTNLSQILAKNCVLDTSKTKLITDKKEFPLTEFKKLSFLLSSLSEYYLKLKKITSVFTLSVFEISATIEYFYLILTKPQDNDSYFSDISLYLYSRILELLELVFSLPSLEENQHLSSFMFESVLQYRTLTPLSQIEHILDMKIIHLLFHRSDIQNVSAFFSKYFELQVGVNFPIILSSMTSFLPYYTPEILNQPFSKISASTNKENNALKSGNNSLFMGSIGFENHQCKLDAREGLILAEHEASFENLIKRAHLLISKSNVGNINTPGGFYSSWELALSSNVPQSWSRIILYGWQLVFVVLERCLKPSNVDHSICFASLVNGIHNILGKFGICCSSNFLFSLCDFSKGTSFKSKYMFEVYGGFCKLVLLSTKRMILKNSSMIKSILQNSSTEDQTNSENTVIKAKGTSPRVSEKQTRLQALKQGNMKLKNILIDNFSQAVFCLFDISVLIDENVFWEPVNHIKTTGILNHVVLMSSFDFVNTSNHNTFSKSINDILEFESTVDLDIVTSGIIYDLIKDDFLKAIYTKKLSLLKSSKRLLDLLFESFGYDSDYEYTITEPINFNSIISSSPIVKNIILNSINKHNLNSVLCNMRTISNLIQPGKFKLSNLLTIITKTASNLSPNDFVKLTSNLVDLEDTPSNEHQNLDSDEQKSSNCFKSRSEFVEKYFTSFFVDFVDIKSHVNDYDPVLKAHQTIHLINAHLQWDILKQRINKPTNPTKNVEDFSPLIELLFIHLSFNPFCYTNWLQLALALLERGDALLLLNEEQIKNYTDSKEDSETETKNSSPGVNKHISLAENVKRTFEMALFCLFQTFMIQSREFLTAGRGVKIETQGKLLSDSSNPIFPGEGHTNLILVEDHVKTIFNLANTLYRISSKPIEFFLDQNSDLQKSDNIKKTATSGSNIRDNSLSSRDHIYKVSLKLFTILQEVLKDDSVLSLTLESMGSNTLWKIEFMIGKALSKLNKRKEGCVMYIKSLYTANSISNKKRVNNSSLSNGIQDIDISTGNIHIVLANPAIDQCVKLLSSITKMLFYDKICVCEAYRYLNFLPSSKSIERMLNRGTDQFRELSVYIQSSNLKDAHNSGFPNDCDNVRDLSICPKCGSFITNLTKEKIFFVIIECLKSVIRTDKKRWHHKPRYVVSWIFCFVFKDYEKAFRNISKIINLRSSRGLINFFKPKFEEPGKYYVYAEKYILYTIKLCSLIKFGDIRFNSPGTYALFDNSDFSFLSELDFFVTFFKKIVASDFLFINKDFVFYQCTKAFYMEILLQIESVCRSFKTLKPNYILNLSGFSKLTELYSSECQIPNLYIQSCYFPSSETRIQIHSVDIKYTSFLPFGNVTNSLLDTREFDRLHNNLLMAFSEMNSLVSKLHDAYFKAQKIQKSTSNAPSVQIHESSSSLCAGSSVKHLNLENFPPIHPASESLTTRSTSIEPKESSRYQPRSRRANNTNYDQSELYSQSSDNESIKGNSDTEKSTPDHFSIIKSLRSNFDKDTKKTQKVISDIYEILASESKSFIDIYNECLKAICIVHRLNTQARK